MAFLRYANATVIQPDVALPVWDEVREKALSGGIPFGKRQASQMVQKFDPSQYLLSHCTIIASVDTEKSGLPLGRQMIDGFEIDRRYPDYLITPNTIPYINNNNDSWERRLLLGTFRTFVGGENYVEHLQIPELSKGKIIDAAARDIGDSVYVDILVATARKHKPLTAAIESGQVKTLSMGCQVAFTICSKCGNVAEDETQLCPHIRFMKGQTYFDGLGNLRKIAELCGHIDAEPGSVKFIEASWVAHPAFTGAVLRNILSPREISQIRNKVQVAFSQPTRTADIGAFQRAAKLLSAADEGGFDFGEGGEFGGEGDKPEKKTDDDPLEKAVGDLADYLKEKAVEKVRSQIGKGENPTLDENLNETLIKESFVKNPAWRAVARKVSSRIPNVRLARKVLYGLLLHKHGGWRAVQASGRLNGTHILAVSRLLDEFTGASKIAGESRLYRTVVTVGGFSVYEDVNSYLAACRRVIGRDLQGSERDALIAKGRLYDLGS